MQCKYLLAFAPDSPYRTIFSTAVVFSLKSRSGYMLNPDVLSEIDFCGLCGIVFRDKRRKRNVVGELRKCLRKWSV